MDSPLEAVELKPQQNEPCITNDILKWNFYKTNCLLYDSFSRDFFTSTASQVVDLRYIGNELLPKPLRFQFIDVRANNMVFVI